MLNVAAVLVGFGAGSLDDGLGRGIDKLAVKATLDGFASVAFAASLGWGVAASALVVLVVQGSLRPPWWRWSPPSDDVRAP